jgi:mannitol/fructose-specific phosphotransferase system IIA component (Ntr-type)
VHILILLAANESAHEAYLNTLSSVASLFNDTTFRRTIIRCKDATQVINLIKEREKILQDKKECKIEQ